MHLRAISYLLLGMLGISIGDNDRVFLQARYSF